MNKLLIFLSLSVIVSCSEMKRKNQVEGFHYGCIVASELYHGDTDREIFEAWHKCDELCLDHYSSWGKEFCKPWALKRYENRDCFEDEEDCLQETY